MEPCGLRKVSKEFIRHLCKSPNNTTITNLYFNHAMRSTSLGVQEEIKDFLIRISNVSVYTKKPISASALKSEDEMVELSFQYGQH